MSEKVKGLTDDSDSDSDVEETPKSKKNKKTDFMRMTGNLISNINYKVAFLLFMIGMIVFSDIFIDGFLSHINDTVSGECPTTKGTMLQLLFMVLAYIILDLVVQYDWL
jgi:hypothetical protein